MRTTLTRYYESELDAAIEEKIKEGYELVWKGQEDKYFYNNKYHYSRKHPTVTKGVETYGKWIAVMKKKEVKT